MHGKLKTVCTKISHTKIQHSQKCIYIYIYVNSLDFVHTRLRKNRKCRNILIGKHSSMRFDYFMLWW